MLKSIFSVFEDNNGTINITINKKGEQYTFAIIPEGKPEYMLSITGTLEEIEKQFSEVSIRYGKVLKSVNNNIEVLEAKVKEAAKPKSKIKTVNKEKIVEQSPVEKEIEAKKSEQEALEKDATEIVENEQIETLENTVEDNNKVLDVEKVKTNNDLF